jgi:hypothetical protein
MDDADCGWMAFFTRVMLSLRSPHGGEAARLGLRRWHDTAVTIDFIVIGRIQEKLPALF